MGAQAASTDKLIGEVLASRYKVEQKLGEGAMGAVYRARHVKVGRPFAVKVLHPRLIEDPKVLQRFEREAELAGRLRHPNVIGVVDVGETADGMRYMVMDFAEGPDLATLLSDAPMTPQRIINLVRQMLEGLYHAHEHGLIHRDFKPENVIVEHDQHGNEVPRIVDFGIAILAEGGESTSGPGRLTTNGLVLGTPHYMAPEQAVADPIDHRIDLFALGIMIYELLCGKLPFDGNGAEVARANLMLDPPPIAQRVPHLEVDPLLEAYARKLMAKKRDHRPATAKAARELLDLVERDRVAAASALGVPASVATRVPAVTQPQAPVRHAGNHEGTFPPSIREAPAMANAVAVPSPIIPSQKDISTQVAHPLPFGTKKTPWVVLALLLLAGGAGVTIYLTRGKDAPPAPVAVAEPKPTVTPVEPPKPAEPPQPVVVPPPPVETQAPTEPKPTKHPASHKVQSKPIETEVKHEEPKPVETKVAPRPADSGPLDANKLAARYAQVGQALAALEHAKGTEAAADLRMEFRRINIATAMQSQASIDTAAAELAKIQHALATRK